eukprot:m.185040 g.185040  ORF g.185040 m.185040 type:complete len:261 (+) comp10006_c1_seq35:51-833(+)
MRFDPSPSRHAKARPNCKLSSPHLQPPRPVCKLPRSGCRLWADLVAERAGLQADLQRARLHAAFLDSLTNTYDQHIKILVDEVAVLPDNAALEQQFATAVAALQQAGCSGPELAERLVYHACHPTLVDTIAREGLRLPSCDLCDSGIKKSRHDAGWFGIHTKGVYVSKHADYTFYYCNERKVRPDDTGAVIMLKAVTGRAKYFGRRAPGAIEPTAGYHCHEGSEHLEHYIFDPAQMVPVAVVHWRAIDSPRAGIVHAGQQ